MQKATVWQLPLAIGVAKDFKEFGELPMSMKCLFYWWEPDISFIAMQPKRIIFPPHDASAWANGNYATSSANQKLDTVVSYDLQALAPDVYTFMSKFRFTIDDMRSLLYQRNSGTTSDSLACTWLTNNENAPGSVQARDAVGGIGF